MKRLELALGLVSYCLTPMLICGGSASCGAADAIPKVALSEQHRAMCKVGVGDSLPKMTLKTPNGDDQALEPLLGKQGAVVVFYQGAAKKENAWMTSMLLADLEPDIAELFGKKGIATIAIQIGGAVQVTPGLIALADPDGEAFAKVGEGKLPRIYLVDAAGKILWFDIEYSNSTRRELRQSLVSVAGLPAVAKRGE